MNNLAIGTIVLILIFWAVVSPLLAIWALNTLFGLGIAYTFINWLAMIVLVAFFGNATVKTQKD